MVQIVIKKVGEKKINDFSSTDIQIQQQWRVYNRLFIVVLTRCN